MKKIKKNYRKIIQLDCTLRDGGYYNNWDFSEDLINNYLFAMDQAGIDFAEIGYRFINNIGYKGPCAFTTEEFLKNINIPESLKIGIMINSDDIAFESDLNISSLDKLVPVDAFNSSVDLIRIATSIQKLKISLEASILIKKKGYKVGINLTHISDIDFEEIEKISLMISKYDLDVFYFADSMGNLKTEQIKSILNGLKKYWKGMIGFHSHDNMNLACANANECLKNKVNWIDSTIAGMGRGAGNLRTEEYILEINNLNNKNINLVPLLKLTKDVFFPLKQKYKWGSNPFYYLAGQYNIHPNYIQQMLSDERYEYEDIILFMENLKKFSSKNFNFETLDNAKNIFKKSLKGSWDPKRDISQKKILLVGVGNTLNQHKKALELFISKYKPIVIAINASRSIDSKLINFRIASNPIRIITDAKTHLDFKEPLITPYSLIPEYIKKSWEGKIIYDYGIEINKDNFEFHDKFTIVPNSNVLAYALGVLASGNSKQIFLAGFDGYVTNLNKNEEVNSIFSLFFKSAKNIKIESITPTLYQIPEKSLYDI